ncbi:MAG: leucine-rich repeat domain-containing protein [Flavobacteriales bacterium]|nr:leucine-rich repeat domain-containing protein [Flavobacteriales bacterium]
MKFLIVWFGVFIGFAASAQNYYSPDVTSKIYTNLNQALNERERVFRLDLSEQNLSAIPLGVFEFNNLESLILDGNKITSLKFLPNQLPRLKYLSLKRNKIRKFHIPKNCLDMLSELYLDQNELIEFPQITNPMVNLIALSLSQNYINELPRDALSLTRLRFLTLDSNPLKNPELAFDYSSYLERLSMYQTGLKKLPRSYIFKNMTKLVISGNTIDYKTIDASRFLKVEYLDISYVPLINMEDFISITQFKNLKYLVAEDIGMTSLMPEIANLKKLREATFLNNQLTTLPEEIFKLKLKTIHLEYNPISKTTIELIQQNMPKTKVFFSP